MLEDVEQTVTFRTPLGEAIEGQLTEIRVDETAHGVETFFIKLAVDYATYEQLHEQELFNLLPQARNELALERLEVGVPVELEAILRPTWGRLLLAKGLTENEVASLLVAPPRSMAFS